MPSYVSKTVDEGVLSSSSVKGPLRITGVVIAIMLVVLSLIIWKVFNDNSPPPPPNTPPKGDVSLYPKYGTFTVSAGKYVDIPISSGEYINVSPVAVCEFDWYVNGKLYRHIGPADTGSGDSQVSNTINSVGYSLTPGKGHKEMVFAYVIGDNPNPDPKWFVKAQKYKSKTKH